MAFLDAPHAPNVAGVWALREFPTGSTVTTSIRNEILQALNFADMKGFCARIHVDQLAPTNGVLSTTFLEALYAVVASVPNRSFAVRVITGRYTPAYVFDTLGARSYSVSGGNGRAPHACHTDGSPNSEYIDWIVGVMSQVADWMRSKGPGKCPLLHWPWFSNQYSEYYHGPEVRSPNAGYDVGNANFIAASNELIDAAHAESDANLTCSFGFSGTHVEDVQVGAIEHMDDVGGPFSPRIMFTANGLSDTGFWGASTETTQRQNTGLPTGSTYNPPSGRQCTHGGQDIQPGNYPVAYRTAQCSLLILAESDIWEIYTPDGGSVGAPGTAFGGSNAAGLQQQISRFQASLGTAPPPPPPAPIVSSVSPASGVVGTAVTITGANFTGATVVRFNGVAAAFTVVNSTTITATVPSTTDGPISVQTPDGTGTSSFNFDVTGGAQTGTLGKVVVTHSARTLTPVGGDPGTVLTPVAVAGIQQPGPAWTGLDGNVYVATRPSASARPKLFRAAAGVFTQISDATYEASAIVPLSGTTDELGRVAVGTQGTGLLIGTGEATPPPPPGGDGSPLRILIAPGNGPLQIVAEGDRVDIGQDNRGITIAGGRTHELGNSEEGKLSLALKNLERKYDPTNTDGPFAGALVPMMPIWVIEDGFYLFSGFVLDWGQTWPAAPHAPALAVVQIEAADAFRVFSMYDLSTFDDVVLSNNPSLSYRFSETDVGELDPQTGEVVTAATVKNYGSQSETGVVGANMDLVLDTSHATLGFLPGPLSSQTSAVEVDGDDTALPMRQGGVIRSAPDAWFSRSFDWYLWPRTLTDGDGIAVMGEMFGTAEGLTHDARIAWKLTANADGSITFGFTWAGAFRSSTSPPGLLTVDGWHYGGMAWDDSVITWYRDEQVWGTSAPPAGSQEAQDFLDLADLVIGSSAPGVDGQAFDGRFGKFNAYPAVLAESQFIANYNARAEVIPAGLAGAQIDALLDMVGWPAGLRQIDAGTVRMQAFSPSGSVLAAMLRIGEDSERGIVQMSADGKVVFLDRDSLLLQHAIPVATFGDEIGESRYSQVDVPWDEQDLYNIVEVTRQGGQKRVATAGKLSERQNGPRTLPVTVVYDSDEDASSLAKQLLAQYREPHMRPRAIQFRGAKGSDQLNQIRTRTTQGDRISFIRRPPGGGPAMVVEAQVEHRSLTWSKDDDWVGVFDLAPAATAAIWVLGVSVLGTDTYMGWGSEGDELPVYEDFQPVTAAAFNRWLVQGERDLHSALGFHLSYSQQTTPGATHEEQQLIADNGTLAGGSWYFTYDGVASAVLAWNARDVEMQRATQSIPALASRDSHGIWRYATEWTRMDTSPPNNADLNGGVRVVFNQSGEPIDRDNPAAGVFDPSQLVVVDTGLIGDTVSVTTETPTDPLTNVQFLPWRPPADYYSGGAFEKPGDLPGIWWLHAQLYVAAGSAGMYATLRRNGLDIARATLEVVGAGGMIDLEWEGEIAAGDIVGVYVSGFSGGGGGALQQGSEYTFFEGFYRGEIV